MNPSPQRKSFPLWTVLHALLALAVVAGLAVPAAPAAAGSSGLEAMERFRDNKKLKQSVENRFFLKENRFEIAPVFGYVPNNPFARRFVGGLIVGYHFSETVSAQGEFIYSPDGNESDLKPLTGTLLQRARNDQNQLANFQQPLDKVALGATFGLAWSPLYGKINLVGETVLNFDFYMFAGLGMITKNNYAAVYDENGNLESGNFRDIVDLKRLEDEVKVAPYLGIGQNYFLNQMMALKLDVRAIFYVDNAPQNDPTAAPQGQRLFNNFVAGGGLSFFFPRMKPRLYDY